jgi:polyhydroxybutyrate depolymerase
MRLILPILFFALLFCACDTDDTTPNDNNDSNEDIELGLLTDRTIQVSGIHREYHLYIPQNYSNAPVVMLFHGHSTSNDALIGLNNETAPYKIWLDKAEQENIILAIPNGLFTSQNEKGWNDCRADAPTNSNADDVQFVSLLIDFIVNTYQADSNRIYANGSSNGGHLCIRLANELSEKLTAFSAIISANAVNSDCGSSNTPISALFMNGTEDPILPYNGGQMASNRGEVFSTQDTIDYWITRNGTDSVPEFVSLPDINSTDNSTVEKYTYSNGTNNTEVVLYQIINGGHTNPSKVERNSEPITNFVGNQNADIEMVDEVWSFFENKSK